VVKPAESIDCGDHSLELGGKPILPKAVKKFFLRQIPTYLWTHFKTPYQCDPGQP